MGEVPGHSARKVGSSGAGRERFVMHIVDDLGRKEALEHGIGRFPVGEPGAETVQTGDVGVAAGVVLVGDGGVGVKNDVTVVRTGQDAEGHVEDVQRDSAVVPQPKPPPKSRSFVVQLIDSGGDDGATGASGDCCE